MNTNGQRAKPAVISIKNAPTLNIFKQTTNNVSAPKVSDSPSRRNKNVESELDQKRKLQKGYL